LSSGRPGTPLVIPFRSRSAIPCLTLEEKGPELSSLEVIDADDVRQIVVLRDPLMLPAPKQSTAKAG
jgi:hypothetical protein